MMEMTAGYAGQSALPPKMMAMSDVDNSHRRQSNRQPASGPYSVGHGSIYESNGKSFYHNNFDRCIQSGKLDVSFNDKLNLYQNFHHLPFRCVYISFTWRKLAHSI